MANSSNYSVAITEASSEFRGKKLLKVTDMAASIPLNKAVTQEQGLILKVSDYAVVDIHNDSAKGDKDYKQYVLIDTAGDTYRTGSAAFYRSFKTIWDAMCDSDEEWELKIYKVPSKNYTDKDVILCTVI